MRPKHLAIALSKLQPHPCSDVSLEQYATEGDLASYWMLAVDELDDVQGKSVVDLGAGNGILGLACLMLGAAHVRFIECDPNALTALEANLDGLAPSLQDKTAILPLRIGVDEIDLSDADLVVSNPPWGVQTARADRPFLDLAFSSGADAVHLLHSMHAKHLTAVAKDQGWESEAVFRTEFRLPPIYAHHSQRKGATEVQCWRFHRPGDAKVPVADEE